MQSELPLALSRELLERQNVGLISKRTVPLACASMKNASLWTKPLPFSKWDSMCCRQMHIHLCHYLLSDSIIPSTYGYGNNIKQLVIISVFLDGYSYWLVKISRKSKLPERKTI